MPIARFQLPDGRVARFEVPEGYTPEQAQSQFEQWYAQQQGQGGGGDTPTAPSTAMGQQAPQQQEAAPVDPAYAQAVESIRATPHGSTLYTPAKLYAHRRPVVPVPVPGAQPEYIDNMDWANPETLPSDDPLRLLEQDREAGFDVSSGAALSDRFMAAVADIDPERPGLKLLALDKMFRQQAQVPDNMPVIIRSPYSEELSYLRRVTEEDVASGRDPEEDLGQLRPTLLNAQGLDLGDIAEFVPSGLRELAVLGAGVGATSAATGIGAAPGAALLTGATAAALLDGVSRPARSWFVREYLGIDDEATAQMMEAGQIPQGFDFSSAAITGGTELAALGVLGALRKVRNTGRPLTEDQLKDALQYHSDIVADLQELERRTGVRIVDTSQGGVTQSRMYDDPDVRLRANAKIAELSSGEQRRIVSQAERERRAFAESTNALIDTSYTPPVTQRSLDATGAEVQSRLSEPLDRAMSRQAVAERELQEYLDSFSVSSRENFLNVQQVTQDAVAAADDAQRALWNRFNEVGADRVLLNPDDGELRSTARALARRAEEAYRRSTSTRINNLLKDLEPLLNEQALDFHRLHETRSGLKRDLRHITANPQNMEGWSASDIERVISAIDNHVANGEIVMRPTEQFSGPLVSRIRREELQEIRDSWLAASNATFEFKRIHQAKAVRDLLATKPVEGGGFRFEMLPNNVRSALLRENDATTLMSIMEAAGDNPSFKAALAEELMQDYISRVAPGGVFSPQANRQFMRNYQDHMNILFGPDEAARISNVESFGLRVQKAQRDATLVQETLRDLFGSSWSARGDMNYSGNIVRRMMTSNANAGQLARTMRRIDRYDPDLGNSIRYHTGEWLKSKLVSSGVTPRGSNRFMEIARNHGDKLEVMYGKQFVNDLDRLGRVARLFDPASGGPKDPAQTAWLQATRTIFGALSNMQRRISAGNRIIRGVYAEKAVDIISDPDKLRQLMRLQNVDPTTRAWQAGMFNLLGPEIAGQLGITEPEQPQFTAPTIEQLRGFGGRGL